MVRFGIWRIAQLALLWGIAIQIPFVTLIFISDGVKSDTFPQERVLLLTENWVPAEQWRRYEDEFIAVRWDVELPVAGTHSTGSLLVNDRQIPLVEHSKASLTFHQSRIWGPQRWILQMCEIGGLTPTTDSRMMYAVIGERLQRSKDNVVLAVELQQSAGRWSLYTIDEHEALATVPMLTFEASSPDDPTAVPEIYYAAGDPTTPYWKQRIIFGAWLYVVLVPAYIISMAVTVATYIVFTIGTLIFRLIMGLVIAALGLASLFALVFGFWMYKESRRSSEGATTAPLPPAAGGSDQTSREVVFDIDEKILEEGLAGDSPASAPPPSQKS
ncbi:hypothetical protein GLOTRDRAFT_140135 [Gloeophyllum trabeum ATCC 11539]|uniref:Uncharacterized protein n=1 Tax=Gloeophyllum trabeum (strain ATCC 11539 / FP-39264 / Madison 617) TaxID=670483 RepID=S7RKT8_GLOTA|nr:uncharacterized protein GLOTRDRAFT_140135 [Gloeophyllum trabeum ATCC 11539]EPQ53284.1 hypothetical protein GLOTRDRAFT_140135 [Gloeophyllum trabeum ATCC 11539]